MLRKFVPAVLVGVATLAFALPAVAAVRSSQVQVVSVTAVVAKGGAATLIARAADRQVCSIVVYGRSGPLSAPGLAPKGGLRGVVSWTWTVPRKTPAGSYPIQVKCGAEIAKTKYRVV